MSTNLSGNILTLGDTSLDESYLKLIKDQYAPTDNCAVGDTVILDGIECLCVATGVTIQGSNLTRIAVDKNYELEYYQKYIGINQNGVEITGDGAWRWGGYGTTLGNTSQEVGYGLQNTIRCLARTVVYTNGTSKNNTEPLMWKGVSDFRSSHSDKWFVPSANELRNYVYPYKSSLNSISNTPRWSSSEYSANESYYVDFYNGSQGYYNKYNNISVRLCRAF